jgi:hypothetical protein
MHLGYFRKFLSAKEYLKKKAGGHWVRLFSVRCNFYADFVNSVTRQ